MALTIGGVAMRLKGALIAIATLCTVPLAMADTPEPVSIPDVPTLTVGKNVGTDAVVLLWTSTAMPYAVVRGTDPNFFGGTPPTIITTGLSATTFDDQVLTDGVNCFYSIEDANIPPKIYGVSPLTAASGETVNLTGLGFAAVLGNNEVFIGGEPAVSTNVTDTLLAFLVPTDAVTGRIMVTTPTGTSEPRVYGVVATSGLPAVSSLAVDGAGTPFVATTGSGTDADRVFTFDPTTTSRTQVGALNEANGLPVDSQGRVYYGNGVVNAINPGSIEFTDSSAPPGSGGTFFRQCGQSAGVDPCWPWGIGLDPDLTDFDPRGRIYVADGANDKVRIVPEFGLVTDFAAGFNFGNAPRGVVADRNSGSSFYHDVFIADATSVRRFDSSTVPGTLVTTYDSTNSPVLSPRQMDITPLPRERLLIADDGLDGIVMINPATDKSKVIGIPVPDAKAIAVDPNVDGTPFAYVGEPTRVLKFPIHRTVFIAVWVANGAPISEFAIRRQIEQANASLEICGFEVQLRDDKINFFDAGALLDLDKSTGGCVPSIPRSLEEAGLLDEPSRRSSEPTDINVYYVRSFTSSGIGRTIMQDCFTGFTDATGSGIIISAEKLIEYKSFGSVNTLAHEMGHALIDQDTWTGGNEHTDQTVTPYTEENIMFVPLHPKRRDYGDADQCLNIGSDATIFRGDP
jgi:hypothetical protein